MESSKKKICPFMGNAYCQEERCAWWCSFAQDCAVPLLAGMFADCDICNNIFEEDR